MTKILLSLAAVFVMANASFAEQTTAEKAAVMKDKTVDSTKKAYRSTKEKVCETFNEKGECVGQKMKHDAKNMKDATATKAKEMKNKVD